MKHTLRVLSACVILMLANMVSLAQKPQPRSISYQAFILSSDGKPVNDPSCPIHVELINDDDNANGVVWWDDLVVAVTDGVINIMLGDQKALPPSGELDHQLSVAVSVRGSAPMRTRLASVPFALNVPDSSISAAKISADYVSAVTVNGRKVTTKGGTLNLQADDGIQLSYNAYADAVRIGIPRQLAPTSMVYWDETGNVGTSPGPNFLGTTDGVGLEFHVNDGGSHADISRAVRIDPRSNSPILIHGYGAGSTTGNTIASSNNGSVIGGGGRSGAVNTIDGDYTVIAGGANNAVYSDSSVISGGYNNTIEAYSGRSTIGGGDSNYIEAHDSRSTIAGGHHNRIMTYSGSADLVHGEGAFIGGGDSNLVTLLGDLSDHETPPIIGYNVIGGGYHNLSGEAGAFVGGGAFNSAFEEYTVVGGGDSNYAGGPYSTIGGGRRNGTGGSSPEATRYQSIGGGYRNLAYGHVSTIAGGDSNLASDDGKYAAIGGGRHNYVFSAHATIAGGDSNFVDVLSPGATIGGGHLNAIAGPYPTTAPYSTIAGGDTNRITGYGHHSFIGGGRTNQIDGFSSVIAGGDSNLIDKASTTIGYDVIGGGSRNSILKTGGAPYDFPTDYATIAGGYQNSVMYYASSVGGGELNEITHHHSTIGGGYHNVISAQYCVIGGGYKNLVEGRYSTIAGGDSNMITYVEADHNFIGGGWKNVENDPSYGVIGGGFNNTLDLNAWASTIGGGDSNTIRVWGSFIGGGRWNTIEDFSDASNIMGGEHNHVLSMYSMIGGGRQNTLDDNSDHSVIAGGRHHLINTAEYSFIGGGDTNTVLANHGAIGGGTQNVIDTTAYLSVVGGGIRNYVHPHAIRSAIGGGSYNHILDAGQYAAIPGGDSLIAQSYAQTVMGFNNVAKGAFVKGNNPAGVEEPILIVGNGVGPKTKDRANAFEVSYDGHSIVFDQMGNTLGAGGRAPVLGGTYNDNILYAWGDVPVAAGTYSPLNDFGVQSVTHLGPGLFLVKLKLNDALGAPMHYSAASITVTVIDDTPIGENGICAYATVSHIDTASNTFRVRTYAGGTLGCTNQDFPFFFKVSGR